MVILAFFSIFQGPKADKGPNLKNLFFAQTSTKCPNIALNPQNRSKNAKKSQILTQFDHIFNAFIAIFGGPWRGRAQILRSHLNTSPQLYHSDTINVKLNRLDISSQFLYGVTEATSD